MKTPFSHGLRNVSLAGGATLLFALGVLPCRGAITYVDLNASPIAIPTNFGGIYIDLVAESDTTPTQGAEPPEVDSYTIGYSEPAAGDWDVNFIFGGAALIHNSTFNAYREGGASDDFLSAVSNLGLRTLIDGSAEGSSAPLVTAHFGASGAAPADAHMGGGGSQFTSGSDGYIGFILDQQDASPLYGWMRVTLNDNDTPGAIHEWAYNDEPIEVGQIPESSTAAAVGVFLLGLAAGRRRRGA